MLINEDIKIDYSDVLIRPKRSTMNSRGEVYLGRTHKFLWSKKKWTGIPIMSANMDTVGTPDMHKVLSKNNMITCPAKHYLKKDVSKFKGGLENICWFGGIDDIKNLSKIKKGFIGLDVANGYTIRFVDAVKKLRDKCPEATIAAGNVVTADMTQELILAGADVVKVGIGPGSVCTTRIQTGVGYPQLSAVIECADAAHGLGGHIVADGGCTCPGDVAKAFGAGADFVMLGGMFAGHNEGGGEIITKCFKTTEREVYADEEVGSPVFTKKSFVQFYGMSSDTAMNKHSGGVANYRSSEGRTVEIPYKGYVKNTVYDLLGGLRSTCTYVGAPTLKQLSKCTTFIRCTQQFNSVFIK